MPSNKLKIDPNYFFKQFTDVASDLFRSFQRVKRDNITNPTDEGEYLEKLLVDFLQTYLPKKMSVGRGYIINSSGKITLQQDVIIYDASNYGLLKNTDGFQVFPVESVYCTIEVKSKLSAKVLKDANRNIESIRSLSGAKLLMNNVTKNIESVTQEGAVIYSMIFAFTADSTMKNCFKNFKSHETQANALSILDRGRIAFYERINAGTDDIYGVREILQPYESHIPYYMEPKKLEPSAMILAFILSSIVEAFEESVNKRGQFNFYEYMKIPSDHFTGTFEDIGTPFKK